MNSSKSFDRQTERPATISASLTRPGSGQPQGQWQYQQAGQTDEAVRIAEATRGRQRRMQPDMYPPITFS
jgi:hypothetical protein